ncbi:MULTISPECIES: hypothetical protein [Hydrocarboniphaga]|uniref:hypothetical protein n=1 Tax=Hydrocarboniphaga TaxID=243627 RepID=UPI00058B2E72|nr:MULTISPECIES: hypothetical protein [Hydrocarboniphaga]MDZ4078190.1 hypothetical protein [Hydrocarboniphaga sp.]
MTMRERAGLQLLLDAQVRDACFAAEQKITEWESDIERLALTGKVDDSVIAMLRQQAHETREALRAGLQEYEETPHEPLSWATNDE